MGTAFPERISFSPQTHSLPQLIERPDPTSRAFRPFNCAGDDPLHPRPFNCAGTTRIGGSTTERHRVRVGPSGDHHPVQLTSPHHVARLEGSNRLGNHRYRIVENQVLGIEEI